VSRRLLATAWVFAIAASMSHPANPALSQASSEASQPASTETVRSPREVHWNLIELDGSPIAASNPEHQPYIYLQAEGDRLSGSLGCNRLLGTYDLSGDSLQFHSVASTRMACANMTMDVESKMIENLKLVTSFHISGDVLSLKVDNRVLAKFEPEKPK
jgi:heat shock protein HslJ